MMAEARRDEHWAGTWTTGPMALSGYDIAGRTVRNIVRISVGADRIRIRLSNTFGPHDLRIERVRLAIRDDGSTTAAGTDRPISFGGSSSVVIAAGGVVLSDPVELAAPPLVDLAVSVFVGGGLSADFPLTGHDPAHQTNYVSVPGDFTGETELPVDSAPEAFFLLTGVDALVPADVKGIVAFGDSLTEGNLSTTDANNRWPDQLARRVSSRTDGPRFGVANQGIGGGRLLHDQIGDSGQRRFDRDVLAQPGATHVVVLLGINDLRNSRGRTDEIVTADQLIGGLHQLAARAHAVGLQALVGTIMPWEHETFNGGHYSEEAESVRLLVNGWIREQREFDGVIDFERALRDPDHPTRMAAQWDSGDHLHPADAGYRHMGDAVDLALFEQPIP